MWKIENIYSDGSKNTLTCTKKVAMNKRLANHYWMLYGKSAEESYFQQYPKKKYEKVNFEYVVKALNTGMGMEDILKELEIND